MGGRSEVLSSAKVKAMAVVDFFQFSERRTARGPLAQNVLETEAALGDRWAQLHAERPACDIREIISHDEGRGDYFGDLLFRLAYPTHRLRYY
jgi:hypothetical protein